MKTVKLKKKISGNAREKFITKLRIEEKTFTIFSHSPTIIIESNFSAN